MSKAYISKVSGTLHSFSSMEQMKECHGEEDLKFQQCDIQTPFKYNKDNCMIFNKKENTLFLPILFSCRLSANEYIRSNYTLKPKGIIIKDVPHWKKEEIKEGCVQTAIWMLSYVSCKYDVELQDEVWAEYLDGIVRQPLPGILSVIPVGSFLQMKFDPCCNRIVAYHSLEDDSDDEMQWWEKVPESQIIRGSLDLHLH